MQQVILRKIHHRDALRIGIFYPKDTNLNQISKKIGARYSATKKCWYIDYSKEAFQKIKDNFNNFVVENKDENQTKVTEQKVRDILPIAGNSDLQLGSIEQSNPEHTNISWAKKLDFRLVKNVGKYWVFELKYHQKIVNELKQIKGVYWNKQYKCYFAFRNSKVKSKIEYLLEENSLFTEDFYVAKTNFLNETIIIRPHKEDSKWMAVYVPQVVEIHQALKRISYFRYYSKNHCYLYPAAPSIMKALQLHFETFKVQFNIELPKGYLNEKNFPNQKKLILTNAKEQLIEEVPEMVRPHVNRLINHLLAKNYSVSTLNTYTGAFIRFLRFTEFNNPDLVEENKIIEYLANLMADGMSSATGNTTVNALKYYYHQVLGRKTYEISIPRPKKEKKLPVFLSQQEVQKLFSVIDNPKHKLLLLMAYGAGLRVGELVSLKWKDIKWDDYKIHIKEGKGKKDRMVMLPLVIIEQLKQYRELYQTKEYVFEGQFAAMPYSVRSVQEIMRKARKKSGLEHKATPHSLRHSFATHLIEKGTDIRYIQQLLGHKDIKTTMIYTHVTGSAISKISSPLDTLNINNENNKKH